MPQGRLLPGGTEGAIFQPVRRLRFILRPSRRQPGLKHALLGPRSKSENGGWAPKGSRPGGGPRGHGLSWLRPGRSWPLCRKLVQDHIAGLGPRCGWTAMQGKNKALQNDMLAKQTKPSANAGGLRMLFLRPWDKMSG